VLDLSAGAPCGAWVEDRDAAEGGSIHLMLKQDIESMGLYPECPEERGALSRLLRR